MRTLSSLAKHKQKKIADETLQVIFHIFFPKRSPDVCKIFLINAFSNFFWRHTRHKKIERCWYQICVRSDQISFAQCTCIRSLSILKEQVQICYSDSRWTQFLCSREKLCGYERLIPWKMFKAPERFQFVVMFFNGMLQSGGISNTFWAILRHPLTLFYQVILSIVPFLQVFAPLARLLGLYGIKEELEELGFRYSKPDEYAILRRHLDHLSQEHEPVVQQVCSPCILIPKTLKFSRRSWVCSRKFGSQSETLLWSVYTDKTSIKR